MNISLNEVAEKLLAFDNIIITAHVDPDGDALGSCLGLYQALSTLGKRAWVVLEDAPSEDFSFLPGFEKINSYEDKSSAELLVILDAAPDRIGNVGEGLSLPVLNIDHHITNEGLADWLYLEAQSAATAEIISRLIEILPVELNPEIALCIYTGMATDTGFFRYPNTTASTMEAATNMLRAGARPEIVSEALEKRSYKEVIDKARAIQTIELFFNGAVAGMFIDHDIYKDLENTEGYINAIRVIEGVEVSLFLKEIEPGCCRVSMRSKNVDVSAIASEFGGGGHIRAAGCTIREPLKEAKEKILAVIKKYVEV